jgi:uncharacterized protein YciI
MNPSLFVIQSFDKQDSHSSREIHYPAHKAFLSDTQKWKINIVMAGPLINDDHTPIGSLFIVEAPDRQTVEKFHQADPFFVNVWDKSTITAFLRRR